MLDAGITDRNRTVPQEFRCPTTSYPQPQLSCGCFLLRIKAQADFFYFAVTCIFFSLLLQMEKKPQDIKTLPHRGVRQAERIQLPALPPLPRQAATQAAAPKQVPAAQAEEEDVVILNSWIKPRFPSLCEEPQSFPHK